MFRLLLVLLSVPFLIASGHEIYEEYNIHELHIYKVYVVIENDYHEIPLYLVETLPLYCEESSMYSCLTQEKGIYILNGKEGETMSNGYSVLWDLLKKVSVAIPDK